MRLRDRYRRLTLWNKIAFWGSIASIAALILTILPSRPRLKLTPAQGLEFATMLQGAPEPREEVRLGCAGADEQACILAGHFLDLFEKAGWIVRGNRVERVQLSKPKGGIVLMKRGVTTEPPPRGSGVWVLQSPSLVALQRAFERLGMPVEQAADASMPKGVIGVFVGPNR